MYDQISADYDRFVNWEARLAGELPFLLEQIQPGPAGGNQPARVLDAACGTGQHAIALARAGLHAAGADLSAGMIARAKANAEAAGVPVRFAAAGFGHLAAAFAGEAFDALLCLGNSLPHLLTPADLAETLADFAACLRPGGKLIVQNRNFDAILDQGQRWMEPQAYREGEAEWLFIRFYDFEPGDLITFNMLTLIRQGTGAWQQRATAARLRGLRQAELARALDQAEFAETQFFGSLSGAPFDLHSSGNLVITAIAHPDL